MRASPAALAVNVVDQWLKSSADSVLLSSLLDSGSLMFELLEQKPVRALLDDHQTGREDNHKLLYSLAMFEQWLRHYPTAAGTPPQPLPVVVSSQTLPLHAD
jgi:asparagine synthase (glutamine-hydrolysing)